MTDTTSAATDIQNVTVTLITRGRSPFAKSSIVVPILATTSACLRTSASSSCCRVRESSVALLVGVGCGCS